MGARRTRKYGLLDICIKDVISRRASASPASGSPIGAAARQKRIIDRTFEYALVKS